MRLLYLLPYLPSLIRVRPYQFLRQLTTRHEVWVVCAGASNAAADAADAAYLRTICHRVEVVPLRLAASLRSCTRAALAGDPLQAGFCRSAGLIERASQLLAQERFDLVHVEHLRAAYLSWVIPPHQPRVFDAVDCISLLQQRTLRSSHSLRQRVVAALELHRTRRYETRLLGRFDHVVATAPDDAAALSALAPGKQVAVVPNGVDLEYFRPLDGAPEPATIVFSGKMSYHANVSAVLYLAREIFPLVRAARPEARLRIVGSRPPREVQRLARDPAITVTGHVADIREAVGRATLAACPMTVKVGIQNKVLEAMALGVPVVCNRLASQGLAAGPEEHLLVGNDPRELAAQMLRVLNEPATRRRLRMAGRRFVETHHPWSRAAVALEDVYAEAVARRAHGIDRAAA